MGQPDGMREAGSKTNRRGSRKTVKKQIETYCSSELVKDAVNGLDAGKFGTAQKNFLWAVKGQRTEAVILLAWLRNRKGL